ncbi:hypothetical protein E1180_04460 [Roseibium denhamense]|uniref:Uncharacterized protein n=1 Tax=Roseibium denhamense TaxID=76305 RepID=A0ABY1PG98_9HYPH|nr:hypothetical protein [Roseibium denhamense]MTI04765.1 hypothetical protein [Roseibium denhamense]SMP33477.1 hypothetical protein SAMN06265374_3755 [Roseibium denhamense]
MFHSRPPRFALGLTTAVSLVALQAAAAQAFEPSGSEIADAFLTVIDSGDGEVTSYGAVDDSGGTVTIKDIVVSNADSDDGQATIASTSLTGGEMQSDGRLAIDELKLENLTLTADDGGLSLQSLTATELLLPSKEELASDTPPPGPGYKSLEINTVAINDENGKVADIQSITSVIDELDGTLPTAGRFSLTGATVDVNALEDDDVQPLKDLGYQTLTVNLNGEATWDPDAATVDLKEFKIDAEDAASLSLAFSLGGVTREVVTELNAKSDKPEEAMALLQNVTISSATIRVDDSSLTGRILDQEAKKAGVETPQYVAGLTGSLPLMLGMLQNQALQDQVASAVTQYLNDPQSLQVTAAPGAPVPISQIMGTAMIAPQMIPQILSVAITAND